MAHRLGHRVLDLAALGRLLVALGVFDPVLSARPPVRLLQHPRESRIDLDRFSGEAPEDSTVRVDVNRGALTGGVDSPTLMPLS